jgi:hypothetical protein
MTGEWLFGLWGILIALAIVVLLYAASEIGFRYGRRYSARVVAEIHTHVVTVEGAVLGLLALLLGFSFSIVMSRYDSRKQTVLNEAVLFQTAYLNAQLLPDPSSSSSTKLLQEYLEARLAFSQALDPAQRDEARLKTSALQRSLWLQATALDPQSPSTIPYRVSLNQLLSDYPQQIGALDNSVPSTLLILLVGVSTLAISVAGYSAGLRRKRLKALRYVLILLVTATLMLIIDLDHPHRRLERTHEISFQQLQHDLLAFQKEAANK